MMSSDPAAQPLPDGDPTQSQMDSSYANAESAGSSAMGGADDSYMNGGDSSYMDGGMEGGGMEGGGMEYAMGEDSYGSAGDSSYDMYSSGGSGMNGGSNARRNPSLLGAMGDSVKAQLTSKVLTAVRSASSSESREKTLSLKERANQAFVGGDEALALKYLYAHMASEYELAGTTFGDVRYSPILREPVWMIRWGASMHVRADAVESPHPIVEGMSSPLPTRDATNSRYGRGRRGAAPANDAGPGMEGMAMGMEMEMEMGGARPGQAAASPSSGASAQIDASLQENLGLVSELVGAEFDSRFSSGVFGRAFQGVEVAPPVAPSRAGPRVDQRTGERIQEAAMSSVPGMEMEANYMADPNNMGAAAGSSGPGPMSAAGSGMDSSYMDASGSGEDESYMSDPNSMMESMEAGMGGGGNAMGFPPNGRPAAAAAAPAAPRFNPDLPRWRPGIAYLGEVPLSESLLKAKENGLQFVLHFDVIVQGSTTRTIVRVVNVADGKTVVTSKKLDNAECYKLVQAKKTSETTYVSEVVTPMFEVIDEKLTVTPMATLTPDVAKRRVATLLETAPAFDLASMSEVRLFQSQTLLTDDETAAAMHLLGGDNALVLVHGTPAERREIVMRELEK